jgi:two-component system, OmpR family, sensor histidine kinase BaeS
LRHFFKIMILSFYLLGMDVNGQSQPSVESLELQIKQLGNQHVKALPILVQIVRQCWLKCPEKALNYGSLALDTLETHSDVEQLTLLLGYLPRVYIDRGEFEKAQAIIEHLDLSKSRSPNVNDLARVLANQGIIYKTTGRYILAKNTYLAALELYKKVDNQGAIGNIYNNLAKISEANNNFAEALDYYLESVPLINKQGNNKPLSTLYSNIAGLYANQHDFDSASLYLTRAESLLDASLDPRGTVEFLLIKGEVFAKFQHFSEAETLVQQALSQSLALELRDALFQSYYELGEIKTATKSYVQAKEAYERAFDTASALGSQSMLNRVKLSLANVAFQQSRYDEASLLLVDVIVQAKTLGQGQVVNLARQLLIDTYVILDKYKQALVLAKEQNVELVQNAEKDKQDKIAQISVLLKQQEQQRIINDLAEQNSQQTMQLTQEKNTQLRMLFLTSTVALLVSCYLYWLFQRRKVAALQAQVAEQLVLRKNQMLSDISHELLTPLAAIKLQIETLEYDLSDNLQQTYATIHSKISSLNRLINDVFQLSQADAGELEIHYQEVHIESFMQDWFNAHRYAANEKGLTLKVNFNLPNDLECLCDPMRLQQVLSNLLTNSCRYTDAPGTILVSAEVDEDALVLTFEDSAPDLPAEQLALLFERLYRADKSRSRNHGGSGLGLSVCLVLVEAHGGEITCGKSNLGGLLIRFSIPLDGKKGQ